MLTGTDETMAIAAEAVNQSETREAIRTPAAGTSLLVRITRIEWLGQMVASMCWTASVFSYGITSTGDWLQLAAAGSWAVANIAAVVAAEDE